MNLYAWREPNDPLAEWQIEADRVEFTPTHVVFWAHDPDRDRIVLAVRALDVIDLREAEPA